MSAWILAALPAAPATVEVLGDGALARELRAQTSGRAPAAGAAPEAIVDTTGDPVALRDALRRVDDLGTVVLAGPFTAGPVPLDLYADLHVRGLTLIGASEEDAA